MPWLDAGPAAKAKGLALSTIRERGRAGKIPRRPHPAKEGWIQYWIPGPGESKEPNNPVPLSAEKEQDHSRLAIASGVSPDEAAAELAAMLGIAPIADIAPTAQREKSKPAVQDSQAWSVVSAWDWHVPEHDPFATAAFLDWLKDNASWINQFLWGGDFGEMASCNPHGGNGRVPARKLLTEIRAMRGMIEKVLAILRSDALKTFIRGNHEEWPDEAVIDNLPALDGVISMPLLLDLKGYGIECVPYNDIYWPTHPSGVRSQLGYSHGFKMNKFHAAANLTEDGFGGTSIRTGHCHTYQSYTRGKPDGSVIMAISTPCLRTLDPPHIKRQRMRPRAVHGFAVDYHFADGGFSPNTIVMHNRRFADNGVMYGRSKP